MSSAAKVSSEPALPQFGMGMPLAMLAAGFVLAVTLGATWVAWERVGADQDRVLRADFEYRVRDVERRIITRMLAHEQVLRGAAGLFADSRQVNRAHFRDYVASLHLEEHYPGIQAVAFAVAIPAAGLARHTREVRGEGFPDYAVRPPGPRDPYTAIVFVEPFHGRNLRAFGFDMFAEPVRREAMERARDQGRAALSGKVRLVQETEVDVQGGVLMYLPVYANGPAPQDVADRRRRLVGWVYMPFRTGDLTEGILGERGPELVTRIHDGDGATAEGLLFESEGGGTADASPGARLEARQALQVAGRSWTLVVRAGPTFGARLESATRPLLAFGGLATGLLLAALTWVLARGRDRATRLARGMNRELLEVHRALQVTERRFRIMADSAPVLIWISGLDKGCTWFNRQWLEFTGRSLEQEQGTGWAEGIHPDDMERCLGVYLDRFDRRRPFTMEYRLRRHDGRYRWLLESGAPLADETGTFTGFVGSCVDITERKLAEEERGALLARAARAERGAALGTLAAGMAHEINNPLTPVLAGIDYVKDQLLLLPGPLLAAWRIRVDGSLPEVQAALDDASTGARRVRDLVADLRSFALGQHSGDAQCDLASALDRSVRVAHFALQDGTTVAVELPPLPSVVGSEAELVQLFGGLLVNAEQAAGERANQVRVTAERREDRVVVRIADTGRGISPEDLPRIFEPFFTTRPVGQGKGLGLSVAQGIAQGLGGGVEVESVAGEGTKVTITLPVGGGS
jgi:PAS domain S-box-containing protein